MEVALNIQQSLDHSALLCFSTTALSMSTQEVLEAKGSLGAPCSIGETRWQVLLFRAIKEGNFDMFMHQATSHPEAIHDYFTKDMHEWELEWESPKW